MCKNKTQYRILIPFFRNYLFVDIEISSRYHTREIIDFHYTYIYMHLNLIVYVVHGRNIRRLGKGSLIEPVERFTSFTWADFERGSATWTVSSGGSRQEFLSMLTLAFIAASSSASRILRRSQPLRPRAIASPRSPG